MENAFIKFNYKMCSYVREICINDLATQCIYIYILGKKKRSLTTHFTENIKLLIQSFIH